MTRKDYELVAYAIRSMPDHALSLRSAKESAAKALCHTFSMDNRRFSEEVFLKSCGLVFDNILDMWIVP